jgi:hypothetical protein
LIWAGTKRKIGGLGGSIGKISDSGMAINLQ